MKLMLAGIAVLTGTAVWAGNIEVPAGETLTLTDFNAVSYNGVTAAAEEKIILHAGSKIVVSADVANVKDGLQQHLFLKDGGVSTLDLSAYAGSDNIRIFRFIYTADGSKLHITKPGNGKVSFGSKTTNYTPTSTTINTFCVISDGAVTLADGITVDIYGTIGCYKWPFVPNAAATTYSKAEGDSTYPPTIMPLGTDTFKDSGLISDGVLTLDKFYVWAVNQTAIPSTVKICLMGGQRFKRDVDRSVTGCGTFTSSNGNTCPNDIIIDNGQLYERTGAPNPTFTGAISSGATAANGTIYLFGWGMTASATGPFLFRGNITSGQRGCSLTVTTETKHIALAKIDLTADGNWAGGKVKDYSSVGRKFVHFNTSKLGNEDMDVSVSTYNNWAGVEHVSTASSWTEGADYYGDILFVYPRQTWNITTFSGWGEAILSRPHATAKGHGNVVIGTWNASGTTDTYLTTNVNVSIGTLNSFPQRFQMIPTAAGSGNTTVFRIGATAAAAKGSSFSAPDPACAPIRVEGFEGGTLNLGVGTSSPTWNFIVDTTKAGGVYCDGACAGSGALTVPASGALTLAHKDGVTPRGGTFPLVTGSSGGLAFRGWTLNGQSLASGSVDVTGLFGRKARVVCDETGVTLKIDRGAVLRIR